MPLRGASFLGLSTTSITQHTFWLCAFQFLGWLEFGADVGAHELMILHMTALKTQQKHGTLVPKLQSNLFLKYNFFQIIPKAPFSIFIYFPSSFFPLKMNLHRAKKGLTEPFGMTLNHPESRFGGETGKTLR